MSEETKIVELMLGGETRQAEISRYSPQHCWFLKGSVVARYRTGHKFHLIHRPQVIERNGFWDFVYFNRRGKCNVKPVAWPDKQQADAKW